MPDLLALWSHENYVVDIQDPEQWNSPNFNSGQKRLHKVPELGESIWLISYDRTDGRTYLVRKLVVEAKSTNPPGYQYGHYRVAGDPENTDDYYAFKHSERPCTPADEVLRSLTLEPASPLGPGPIPQRVQTMRQLTKQDSRLLQEFADRYLTRIIRPIDGPGSHLLSDLITDQETQASRDGAFDPETVEDSRSRTLASIVRRRGQTEFRRQLLQAYGGRCAVTGCDAEPALEAAHIIPYRGPLTNHVSNGLLLRADIHTLFDLGLIAFDSESLTVVVHPNLEGTHYWELDGNQMSVPLDSAVRPSQIALERHRRWANV